MFTYHVHPADGLIAVWRGGNWIDGQGRRIFAIDYEPILIGGYTLGGSIYESDLAEYGTLTVEQARVLSPALVKYCEKEKVS